MNDGGVCRTAPATRGLLKRKRKNAWQPTAPVVCKWPEVIDLVRSKVFHYKRRHFLDIQYYSLSEKNKPAAQAAGADPSQ